MKKLSLKRVILIAFIYSLIIFSITFIFFFFHYLWDLAHEKRVFSFKLPLSWFIILLVINFLGLIITTYRIFIKKSKFNSSLASSRFLMHREIEKHFALINFNKVSASGFLISSELKNKNESFLVRLTNEPSHALVIGATRSGKTARLVNPNIQLLAKTKSSMIISDPKGELYEFHRSFLELAGYEIFTLNLRNHEESSLWNPLEIIWSKWHENLASEYEREIARDQAKTSLSQLASVIFPDPARGETIWVQGANTIFQFMVLAMLELSPYDKHINLNNFNIHNILVNLNSATYTDLVALATLLESLAREENKISHALAIGGRNIRGAEATVNGMVQNAVSMLKVYNDTKVKRIISKTTIKLDDTKMQAIFLIVPDEEKSTNAFISLFVAETYKEWIRIATKNEHKKLRRPLYYLLDEFGNIPKIPNLDAMVTVSASRNIFFMFILQNYKQINETYGENIASIIMSNCGYQYYLLTNDHATAELFSKTMGETEIETASTSSSQNGKTTSFSTSKSDRTRRLMHADELMKLKPGEVIILAQRLNPIKTTLAPFWEFKREINTLHRKEVIKNTKNIIFNDIHVYNFVRFDSDELEVKTESDILKHLSTDSTS